MKNNEQIVLSIVRDYYACLEAKNAALDHERLAPNDNLTTLREFLRERGFSYSWLNEHGYCEEDDA